MTILLHATILTLIMLLTMLYLLLDRHTRNHREITINVRSIFIVIATGFIASLFFSLEVDYTLVAAIVAIIVGYTVYDDYGKRY